MRQGLINFKAIAEGQYREVEKGTEPESKGSFKLPENLQTSSNAAPKDVKKGAPPPKDAAKGGKAAPTEDSKLKHIEGEDTKKVQEEAAKLKEEAEAQEKRSHPHIGLWLSIKVEIINLLMGQKRYEDCSDAIAVARLEAQSVRD